MAMVRTTIFAVPTDLETLVRRAAVRGRGFGRGYGDPKYLQRMVEQSQEQRCARCQSEYPAIAVVAWAQMGWHLEVSCDEPECYAKAYYKAVSDQDGMEF